MFVDECTPVAGSPLKPDPRRVGGSINYIFTPAIKQCYYRASARRPGKAGESKCTVMLPPELCGTSLTQNGSSPPFLSPLLHTHNSHQAYTHKKRQSTRKADTGNLATQNKSICYPCPLVRHKKSARQKWTDLSRQGPSLLYNRVAEQPRSWYSTPST